MINESKPALFKGFKKLISDALNARPDKTKFCSRTTSQNICSEKRFDLDLRELIEDMWKQLLVNWVEGGCQWRGSSNWRWELQRKPDLQSTQHEIRMQRTLANILSEDRWSNETPTGSGLGPVGWEEPGGLDLAYKIAPDRVLLIELKIDSDSPVSAALQIVSYALVLILARLVHTRLIHKDGPIKIAEPWRSAKYADLRILAPNAFYKRHPQLLGFQDRLSKAIDTFSAEHGLSMTFAFRSFGEDVPTSEDALIAALENGKVVPR